MSARAGLLAVLVLGALCALFAYLFGAPADDEPAAVPAAVAQQRAHVRARLELDRAREALRQGDTDAATRFAQGALALDDDSADALRLLAVLHKRAGRDAEACRHMRDYVRRAATPEPARARLLESACTDAGADGGPP